MRPAVDVPTLPSNGRALTLSQEHEAAVDLGVGLADDVVDGAIDTVHLVRLTTETDELRVTSDSDTRVEDG